MAKPIFEHLMGAGASFEDWLLQTDELIVEIHGKQKKVASFANRVEIKARGIAGAVDFFGSHTLIVPVKDIELASINAPNLFRPDGLLLIVPAGTRRPSWFEKLLGIGRGVIRFGRSDAPEFSYLVDLIHRMKKQQKN